MYDQLLNALQEKELLIKEIHHRVKNNLQLISSILYIRMSKVEHSNVREFLDDARQKIRSIALIHERLLQTETLNEVEVNDYLGRLILDLHITYLRQDFDVDIITQIDYVKMGVDNTIYCGLIVNELVTNALKHAFVGRTKGCITVRFNKVDNLHILEVGNDGDPLPETISIGSSGSFGMHMLDVFIKQLKGTIEINRENGTLISISF
jgi:two-component sensor histidine kinase